MDMNLGKLWEIVKDRGSWHAAVHGLSKSRTQQSDFDFDFPCLHRGHTGVTSGDNALPGTGVAKESSVFATPRRQEY